MKDRRTSNEKSVKFDLTPEKKEPKFEFSASKPMKINSSKKYSYNPYENENLVQT